MINSDALLKHNQALKKLSGSPFIRSGHLKTAFEFMTETLGSAMELERTSFWSYHPEKGKIVCEDLYCRKSNSHERGKELFRSDFPAYFKALETQELIIAPNAYEDPRTCEFSEDYLKILKIVSMLDIPIFFGQNLYGVICLEHVGSECREWTSEEELFGMAVADFVSLSLESQRRSEVEATLLQREQSLQILLNERNRALAEQESFLKTMTESIQDALIVVNENDQIIFWNSGASSIFGYPAHLIMFRSIFQLLEPYSPPVHTHLHEFPMDILLERNAKDQSGRVFPVEFQLNRMRTGQGLHTIALFRDLTQRKAFEEQLQQATTAAQSANHAKSEFLANMSHEIRTPMNAILGFSELLSQQLQKTEQLEYVQAIKRSSHLLLGIINDILDLSKIEAGKLEIQPNPTQIQSVLNEIQLLFTPKAQEKALEISFFLDENTPDWLLLDELRFRQILINLISNAIKFTEKGGVSLKISCSRQRNDQVTLFIEISDTGIGIPQDQQSQIFQAFVQQNGQSTRKYGGSGLGLTITQQLIERMNGFIHLESTPGKGSRFEITLTEVSIAQAPEHYPIAFNTVPQFTPATLMVVDDLALNRLLIKSFLQSFPFIFIEAEEGETALSLLREKKPDLILMDVKMPLMDGIEATQQIRKDPQYKDLPVLAMTASVMKEEEKNCLDAGFNAVIRKPIEYSVLLQVLNRFLPSAKQEHSLPPEKEVPSSLQTVMALDPLSLLNEIETLKDSPFMKDILSFACELHSQLKKNTDEKSAYLLEFVHQLEQAAQAFELEHIQKILTRLEKYLQTEFIRTSFDRLP